jgi:hypothetical protein
VAYVSRSNNKIETKYKSYEGECLIVVSTVFSLWCSIWQPIYFGYQSTTLKFFDGIKLIHR